MSEPRIGLLRQDQVRGSAGGDQLNEGYSDLVEDERFNSVDAQSPRNTLLQDLNFIRTVLRKMHGGAAWFDIVENGTTREVFSTRNCVYATAASSVTLCYGANPDGSSRGFTSTLSALSVGMMTSLLTLDVLNGLTPDDTSQAGRIAAADARPTSSFEGVDRFYSIFGTVVALPSGSESRYRLVTRGNTGLSQIFSTSDDAVSGLLNIVPGETYYLGANGEIVTQAVIEDNETWRITRVGYGIYDPTVDNSVNPYRGILHLDYGDTVDRAP